MTYDDKPDLPRWHINRTNGINDVKSPDRFHQLRPGGKIFNSGGANRRNCFEWNGYFHLFEPRKNGKTRRDHRVSLYEPVFVAEPYELITSWIPRQDSVLCVAYEVSDGSILELLAERQATLIVNAKPWMHDPTHYSGKQVQYWYPKMRAVYVFNSPDPMIAMYQKYLSGTKYIFKKEGGYRTNESLIMGSFNLTENAKRSIESVLYVRKVSHNLSMQVSHDRVVIERHCISWEEFIEKGPRK